MENFLVGTDFAIKICDFGLSKRFENKDSFKTLSLLGTPPYIAPEVWMQKESYSYECDWWSLGAMLVMLALDNDFIDAVYTSNLKYRKADSLTVSEIKMIIVYSEADISSIEDPLRNSFISSVIILFKYI